MDRRKFLIDAGRAGLNVTALMLATPLLPKAWGLAGDDRRPRFFVLITVGGGMDVTLGLDPRVHAKGETQNDIFLEYRPDDIQRIDGIALGPAAKVLAPWAKSVAIVNGISMRADVGHESLRDYLATGRGDGSAGYLPVALANAVGTGPLGVLNNDPRTIVRGSAPVVNLAGGNIEAGGVSYESLDGILELKKGFGRAAKGLVESSRRLAEAQSQFAEIESLLGDAPPAESTDTSELALLAARNVIKAFSLGLANFAVIHIDQDPEIDTHADHEGTHLAGQTKIWQTVADLFAAFGKIPLGQKSLFEETTFMVGGEFSRTPYLNARKGKDHNPLTNSALFAGKGINGGTVVGASRVLTRSTSATGEPMHVAGGFDFKDGKPLLARPKDMTGVGLIYPENLARTMAVLFGDSPEFDSVSRKIPTLKTLLKA